MRIGRGDNLLDMEDSVDLESAPIKPLSDIYLFIYLFICAAHAEP